MNEEEGQTLIEFAERLIKRKAFVTAPGTTISSQTSPVLVRGSSMERGSGSPSSRNSGVVGRQELGGQPSVGTEPPGSSFLGRAVRNSGMGTIYLLPCDVDAKAWRGLEKDKGWLLE